MRCLLRDSGRRSRLNVAGHTANPDTVLEIIPMATWAEFSRQVPELAERGRALLYREGHGSAILASVRGDAPPRLHPISVGIVGDGLYAFILASAKRTDLEQDGRYALHAHIDPVAPDEFALRGRVRAIGEPIRSTVAEGWFFSADEGYELFEFDIESALLGERPTADDWPPRYTTWRSNSASGTLPGMG
jgi:hypothetical protein